jgi:hypothetical protein
MGLTAFVNPEAWAGSLTPPGAPSAGSGMPTLEQIYNRLDTGAGITVPAAFVDPGTGPSAPTGRSLNDIKARLPTPDNTNGAAPAEVSSGRTFWGLRTDGSWGLQTGTAHFVSGACQPGWAGSNCAVCDAHWSGPNCTINDQTAALVLSGTSLTVTEGRSAQYGVSLLYRPTGTVTVSVTSSNPSRASVSPSTLSFTSLNWNQPQTVTVSAIDDKVVNGSATVNLTHQVTGSADPAYASAAAAGVTVTVNDVNAVGIVAVPMTTVGQPVAVFEGQSVQVGFRLATRPNTGTSVRMQFTLSNNVVVDGHNSLTNSDITWTSADWNTVKYVTINALQDGDSNSETHTVEGVLVDVDTGSTTLTSAQNDPNHYTFGSFTQAHPNLVYLTNVDDDTPGIVITPTATPVVLAESGGSSTASVRLANDPGAGTWVTVGLSTSSGISVSPSTLVFAGGTGDPKEWGVGQTITLMAIDDQVAQGDHRETLSASVVHSTSATYPSAGPLATLVMQVTDDETLGVTVQPQSGLLCSGTGGGSVFVLRLNSAPNGTVRIAVSSSDTGVATANVGFVEFSPSTWSVPQLVTVSGVANASASGHLPFVIHLSVVSVATTDTTGYLNAVLPDVRGSTLYSR